MSDFFGGFFRGAADLTSGPRVPLKLSARTLGSAVETVLMTYTRRDLEVVLAAELELAWVHEDSPSDQEYSKRSLVQAYTAGWAVPQLVDLARRIVTELDRPEADLRELMDLVALYDAGGGVAGPTKNLIFAANGPKPDIVLRDAMSNDIEIVANGEYCLVYDEPIPAQGLRFSHLVQWWRDREQLPNAMSEHDVGRALHQRLAASLDSKAERAVFEAYAGRYRTSFDIPALIPQVYLHYDPYDQRVRRSSPAGVPLTRQRMDFLLLFSDRRRVVIEVDGKQHYATGDVADPRLYAQMVEEDRRLRLTGYEVYRFGGAELFGRGSKAMVEKFFDDLAERMK